jgi:hypothetical protein
LFLYISECRVIWLATAWTTGANSGLRGVTPRYHAQATGKAQAAPYAAPCTGVKNAWSFTSCFSIFLCVVLLKRRRNLYSL